MKKKLPLEGGGQIMKNAFVCFLFFWIPSILMPFAVHKRFEFSLVEEEIRKEL